jgi:hypothetical protein
MAADRSKQEARRQWIRHQIANPPRVPPKILPKCSFCLESIPDGAFSVSQSPSGVRNARHASIWRRSCLRSIAPECPEPTRTTVTCVTDIRTFMPYRDLLNDLGLECQHTTSMTRRSGQLYLLRSECSVVGRGQPRLFIWR